MKHTPGPWRLHPNSTRSKGVYATVAAYPLRPETWETEKILSLVCEARISHEDAVLIAAAPDLLKSLEKLMAHIEWLVANEIIGGNHVEYENARQQIAKARGEV